MNYSVSKGVWLKYNKEQVSKNTAPIQKTEFQYKPSKTFENLETVYWCSRPRTHTWVFMATEVLFLKGKSLPPVVQEFASPVLLYYLRAPHTVLNAHGLFHNFVMRRSLPQKTYYWAPYIYAICCSGPSLGVTFSLMSRFHVIFTHTPHEADQDMKHWLRPNTLQLLMEMYSAHLEQNL